MGWCNLKIQLIQLLFVYEIPTLFSIAAFFVPQLVTHCNYNQVTVYSSLQSDLSSLKNESNSVYYHNCERKS